MQIKSETKLPNTVITITLNSAKEMYDFNQLTHEHTEYTTEWSAFLYSLFEYNYDREEHVIDSHVWVTICPDREEPADNFLYREQPDNGDIIARINMYCKDTKKLDYIETEITNKLLSGLTVTIPEKSYNQRIRILLNAIKNNLKDDNGINIKDYAFNGTYEKEIDYDHIVKDMLDISELKVLKSAAGYYVGRTQEGMPYSRQTAYFKTSKEAQEHLDSYPENMKKIIF